MKRSFILWLCVVLIGSILVVPVSAAELTDGNGDEIIVSQTVEDMGNGCYFIETISVPSIQPYSDSVSGTKSAVYVSSGVTIFSVSVTGTFSYDGSTAKATKASGSVYTYVEDAVIISSNAYTSGASAYATASVSYESATLSKTVKLTCDKDGNLS